MSRMCGRCGCYAAELCPECEGERIERAYSRGYKEGKERAAREARERGEAA